jgi:exonuclease VII large subunit
VIGEPFSVGQLADYLRDVLALDPVLSDVWVTGEVVDARMLTPASAASSSVGSCCARPTFLGTGFR